MKKKRNGKKLRGFAAMSPAKRKAIASCGGKAAQRKGTGHQWSKAEAKEMAKKGGKASQESGKGMRFDSESAKKAVKKRWRKAE